MASRSDIMAGRAFVELYVKKEGLTQGLANARQKLRDFGNAANALGRTMIAMGLATGTGLAVAGNQFIAFDDQMRTVKAVSQSTEAEFLKLTASAKRLGATTSFTAVEVAKLMTELGRAGFSAAQVDTMTAAVLDLSRASGTDAATSAGIMAATIRQFGLAATDAVRVADALTNAANKSFSSVTGLGESLSYAGPIANDFNMSIEETLAILGALGNVGIQGSEAGIALRRLLTITGAEATKLKGIFGVSFQDAVGNARPLVDVLSEVSDATKHLGTAQRAAKYNEAFGLLGITAASALGKTAVSARELLTALQQGSGAAAKTSAEMDAGPGGALRRLTSAIEGAALSIGGALSKAFEDAANVGIEFANTISNIATHNQGLVVGIAKTAVGLLAGGAALLVIGTSAKAAALGLGVLQVALTPAAYGAGILLAGLKNMGIATQSAIRALQGLAGTLGGGLVAGLNLARVGLANVVASAVSMAGGLARAAMSAGNAIHTGLISVIARVPAAFNGIVAAARSAFAGASSAASKFSGELRYWLSRPFEYFKALAPLLAQDLQLAMSNAMGRIRAASAQAADGLRVAWNAASTAVKSTVSAMVGFIASRFNSVANPLTEKLVQAWTVAAGAISSRMSSAWNAIAGSAGAMLSNLVAKFAPAFNKIRASLTAVLPLMAQDFTRIAGYAAVAARLTVSAWRFVGTRIASMITTPIMGAFARIRSMSSGIGSGLSGLSGLVSGGAGLLGQLGIGVGGMLGQVAMLAPSIMMLASSFTMLVNPATVAIAAIAGGIYVWTQFSAEGKAALATVTEAFGPMVAAAQKTFAGVAAAVQSGNLALAGKIAMAGLRLSLIEGMAGLGQLLTGSWKEVSTEVGDKMGGEGMLTPWQRTMETMAAIWDQWAVGVVRTFTDAMRAVTDAWQGTVEGVANFMLTKSAEGGLMGQLFSKLLGVDMNALQADEELKRQRGIKSAETRVKQSTADVAEARQTGGLVRGQNLAAHEIALANAKADLAKLTNGRTDVLGEAKQDVAVNVGKSAEGLRKFIDELDRDAEARANNSAPQLPNWQEMRDLAQKQLDALLAQGKADNDRRAAWDEIEKLLGDEAKPVPGVAGGGADAAGVKGMLESKSMGATFSAAAAIAMGRGGGGGNPQERAAKAAEKQVDLLKEQKELLEDQKMVFKVMGDEVVKAREVAEGDQELLVNIANEIRDLNVGLE